MIESVSRRAFSGFSGTYHVRASELAKDKRYKAFSVTVNFLDDASQAFTLDKRDKGSVLLDQVYHHLELIEKDYFGLQFSENGTLQTNNSADNMRWLDPTKNVKKQCGNGAHLYFRVKFYVSDPSKLAEEFTRYQFYLQIRNDIRSGKLQLPSSTACLLASYMVQSELGDYLPDEHGPNYLSKIPLLPGQDEDMEKKIAELHKLHKNQLPADAEFNFLDHAKRLDMYGVELHHAQDTTNKDIQLGVTSIGLVVFHNNIRINTFSWSKIVKISFKRKQFFIQLRREPSESYDTLLGFNMQTYRSSKGLWKSCVEHHTFFRLHSPHLRSRRFPLSFGSRFRYSGRTERQTVEQGKLYSRASRTFVRSPSKPPIVSSATHIMSTSPGIVEEKLKPASTRSPWCDNKVQSLGSREPRKAWEDSIQVSDDDGGFLEKPAENAAFCPAGRVLNYADEEENGLYDTPPYSPSNSPVPYEGLVTVKLVPDVEGRFGFNVKGGKEQNMPILVSRVAPNTPADHCVPKIREGDQVYRINGQDVTNATHSMVVTLIRTARDKQGELELVLKQAASPEVGNGISEEPLYCYVPESPQQVSMQGALAQSILLLADGLASGALVSQYEQLYRRHPELSSNEARRPENIDKNRYRDISPYDVSRVVLMNGINGDYINANHVHMHITGTDTINHYIATQGPLSTTVDDFWQMISESDSSLIVMLTTLVERGKVKCHQYWPNTGEMLALRNITVSCNSEITDPSNTFVFRDLTLRNSQNGIERSISHMQYLAWPDHGVPVDTSQFLRFTQRVREARIQDSEVPVVVHCSAGIGRTGVLILMDTAMCLIEVGQPVYPLDIVQTMRDQRAMMIQNASQYKFVCESVHAAYTSGIIQPETADTHR